jgi:hypothetical protein
MNISQQSLTVLKNFSSINPSIQFKEGNVLKTISPNKTILARAVIPDNIERGFAIYDLSRFLGILSVLDKPTVDVGQSNLSIKSEGRQLRYMFADPSVIVTPPDKELDIGTPDISFDLKQSQLDEVQKALGIMSLPDIVVAGEDGKIILRATDSKNPTADTYDIEVGVTDKSFNVIFKSENMKMMSGDYKVSISSRGISHFVGENIEYWISIEQSSKF